jgi:SAM-dependent methyltransferase
MGKKRSDNGYNEGKFKQAEYFLKGLRAPVFKFLNSSSKQKYTCPICNYHGPFMDKKNRHDAKCPKCGELERARIAMLVLRKIFKKKYKSYISSDLYRKDVDYQFDIQDIPFPDNSFDLVFASHVLEYVKNDTQAIKEIKRVLRPGGLAFLPVPMLHEKTIDYDKRPPNKRIIRETGVDYFDRYRKIFSEVRVYDPGSFDKEFNLTIDMEDKAKTSSENKIYQIPNLLPVCRA